MHSRHVPSPSLLRFLARKTLEATEFRQAVHTTGRQCRKFSCSNRRPAVPSARASRNAREGARQWASTRWSDKDPKGSLAPFRDVLNSEFVRQDFREQLGLVNSFNVTPAPDRVATLVLRAMKENNSPARLADYCIGTGKVTNSDGDYSGGLTWTEAMSQKSVPVQARPLAHPAVIGQAFYILGYQFLSSKEADQQYLGDYMMKTAVLMGNCDATKAVLSSVYHRKNKSSIEPSPIAHQNLDLLAQDGRDIGGMCLRAEMLMWPKQHTAFPTTAQRSRAHAFALEAFERSEAGPQTPPPTPHRVTKPVARVPEVGFTPPWKILQRMAETDTTRPRDTNRALWRRAISAGAREYDDPSACDRMIAPPSLVPVGSAEWLTFATKAAMAGKGSASFYLGQYYLELHGWYPPEKVSSRKRSRLGFQWIETSLWHTADLTEIQKRAFLMALLLRENGLAGDGVRWLEKGAERVDEVAAMKGADKTACAEATRFFESCIKDWHLPMAELPPDWKLQNYYPEPLLKGSNSRGKEG